MLNRLLSGDYPRSKVLAAILLAVLLGLALAPFLFPGVKALNVAAKVLVFVVLVASFDLLLGYTGIVSFAHTMFFGIGAYGIAVATTRMGPTWSALLVGGVGAAAVAVLSLAVGLFSLRVRAIFFAMITLAVAAAFQTLASQLSDITGGEDGLTFKVPEVLSPSFEPFDDPFLGVTVDGRLICYPLFVTAVVLVLALLRIVNSPFGRVLQAIRENEFRAEAIVAAWWCTAPRPACCRPCSPRWRAACWRLAALQRARHLAQFEIMMDCLLIVVIGGMGTIYGSVIGAVLFLVAQSYLQDLLRLASEGRQRFALAGGRCSRPTAGCCGWASCLFCRCTTFPQASSGVCDPCVLHAEHALVSVEK